MNNLLKVILLVFILCLSNLYSQFKGKVVDVFGEPLEMVDVYIQNSDKGAVTDDKGGFSLSLNDGVYKVNFSYVGYKTLTQKIKVKNKVCSFKKIVLKQELNYLDGVVVKAKTKSQIIREKSFAVEVVEMEGVKNISTDVTSVLGKVSGVNIRQSGGLGSDFSLSLNGFYGNQVRTFIDGIPMHYFGSSLSLNNFPANLVEGIEVYKGVVPIHLSSDALGGAINVTTNKSKKKFLDASYSIGSFNTHRYSINGQYRAQNGFTTRLKSFNNYSDNNYKVPIYLLNKSTGKLSKKALRVKRFHDAYSSQMIWTEFGVTGKKYADELMFGVLVSDNYNEIQQSPNTIGESTIPYGEVDYQEEKVIANLSFNKKNIIENLSVSSYLVGVFSDRVFSDISDYEYNWLGDKTLNKSRGEMETRKTRLALNENSYLANVNTEYVINTSNSIAANYSLNYLKIKGEDDYRKQNQTQFKDPSTLKKQITGISYTNSSIQNFKTSIFGKYYRYNINTIETDYYGDKKEELRNDLQDLGYGIATSYQFKNLQLKASYEKAFRFPEVVELFGNGIEIQPQPNLQPEKSSNVNLGFIYKKNRLYNKFSISVNSFLRKGEDYIYPTQWNLYTLYKNTRNALTKGVDLSLAYNLKNTLLVNLSGSFYDKRNTDKWKDDSKTKMNILYDIRFPNEPYFSGNASISYKKENFLYTDDSFVTSIRQNYVHEFYYSWENLGAEDKEIVPVQHTSDLEIVYSLQKQRYNISFGVVNIFDKSVYDNYKQTKPGRILNLKLRYFIN